MYPADLVEPIASAQNRLTAAALAFDAARARLEAVRSVQSEPVPGDRRR